MSADICFIEDCVRKPVARGLCDLHYYAAKRAGKLDEIAPKRHGKCEFCAVQIPQGRRFGARFCSKECKEQARVASKASMTMRRRTGRVCVQCDGQIPLSRRGNAKTCSAECNSRYQTRVKQEAREQARPRGNCAECGQPIPETRRLGVAYCSPACKKAVTDRRWREKSPGYMRERLYGITQEQFDAMLASQDNGCAICHTDTPGGRGGWHVDHCHSTGRVRGLLCHHCNVMLGNAGDNPARLRAGAAYLELHPI